MDIAKYFLVQTSQHAVFASSYSLHEMRELQKSHGGKIEDEAGNVLFDEPEPPQTVCYGCGANNTAFVTYPCWCCGDYALQV